MTGHKALRQQFLHSRHALASQKLRPQAIEHSTGMLLSSITYRAFRRPGKTGKEKVFGEKKEHGSGVLGVEL